MANVTTGRRHIESLDALRALAALLVLAHHLQMSFGAFNGHPFLQIVGGLGWVGVDLFYVLSGYLIVSAIIFPSEWRIFAFAEKRLRRIAPAYYLVVLICVARLLFFSPQGSVFSPDWAYVIGAHLLFMHNLFPASHGALNGVFWTLGVEFSFYVLAALCARGLRNPQKVWWILGAWILCALAWRFFVFKAGFDGIWMKFYVSTQLPGSLDAFAVGGVIAALHKTFGERSDAPSLFPMGGRSVLVWGGVAIVCLVCTLEYLVEVVDLYWQSFFAMVTWRFVLALAFSGLLLVCLTVAKDGWFSRFIRYSGLGYLGSISYGVYLFQLPVIDFLKTSRLVSFANGKPLVLGGVMFVVICAVASVCYRFVEQPWLVKKLPVH